MGFSVNRSKHALLACNNDAELASNWLFERMEDECKQKRKIVCNFYVTIHSYKPALEAPIPEE
jgi:uncharacterized UBP type Zn finger protein